MDKLHKLGEIEGSPPMRNSWKFNYPTTSSEPLNEEKKLTNWKRWLSDRKKHYESYRKKLGRSQDELLLNSGEKFRSLMEIRELMGKAGEPMTIAYIQKKVDLGFWISPEVLPDRGNPNLPKVQVPPLKKSNVIPKMEHVATPKIIFEEKGLSVPKQNPELRNEYLKKRIKELSDIISVIEPNPPEIENLFVRGKNVRKYLKKAKSVSQNIPIITVTTAEETEMETSEWSINPDAMIAALRIENEDIVRRLNPKFGSENKENGPYNWDIKFISRGSELVEKKIFIENRGNFKITFYWRPVLLSSDLFPSQETSAFFFNKNKGIILPGQILHFPIWFNLSLPGVRTENWKLETDPRLSSDDLLFRFWGCCTGEDQEENRKKIYDCLERRSRDITIKAILEEIAHDALIFQPPDPPYKTLFLESEIFSTKNASYFYHPRLVKEFREIFKSISISDNAEWNLSIFDFRKILLGIEDPEFQQIALARFVDLCRASLEPSLYNSSIIRKHEQVFDLLCSFVNQFETESEFIRNICFGSCVVETGLSIVRSRDRSRSNSPSRNSSGALTPQKKIKSKKKNRRSLLSTRSKEEEQRIQKFIKLKPSHVSLFREIFYLRIYELFGETISKACATIDSYVRLNEPEK
ncbi:MYCBP-associated protein [Belonocnema kinseyi]|uniref:MYCBP-associated protein n=1 Tax=Belonocnema kinseyi TaxID=2817044 RepID=UPI00143D47F9|nr:MYCBP-associated protein [Belonocnema kinseyi]